MPEIGEMILFTFKTFQQSVVSDQLTVLKLCMLANLFYAER